MPDSRRYIAHYVKYFNIRAPSSSAQAFVLLVLGAIFGVFSSAIINMQNLAGNYAQVTVSGLSSGIIVISVPALLAVLVLKVAKRRMQLKHAMLTTLIITIVYAFLFFLNSAVFSLTRNAALDYLLLLLMNAGIYSYWFFMGRVVIGKEKSAIPIAAVQPVLNVIFYVSLAQYRLGIGVALGTTLIKLFAGMAVFLLASYALLYFLDRPSRRLLEASGMKVVTSMVGQWLYDLTNDVSVVGYGAGIKRDLNIEMLALRGRRGYKGLFLNPDIHFGPFRGVGGSIAPARLGDMLVKRYGAAPFVLHSPLDVQDNPISTSQVYKIAKQVEGMMGDSKRSFDRAYGNFTIGQDGRCRATNITVGDTSLFLLSKAPYVTEDMSREVGMQLAKVARSDGRNAILVDAHNSRFEYASSEELDGIQKGNRYVRHYEEAIRRAMKSGAKRNLRFGAAYKRLAQVLGRPADMGEGYTGVCVFRFGKRRFCLVYFDANNMLPNFREKIAAHIMDKFGMQSELCTTDTHFINTVAYGASNSLGRHTQVDKMIQALDPLIQKALDDTEPVSYAYKKVKMSNFPVWGDKADALIERAGRDARRILKFYVPLIVIAASIVAAVVIYVV